MKPSVVVGYKITAKGSQLTNTWRLCDNLKNA